MITLAWIPKLYWTDPNQSDTQCNLIKKAPYESETSTAAVDIWHLKVEVVDYDFLNCSCYK